MSIIVQFFYLRVTTLKTGESFDENVLMKEHFLRFSSLQETTSSFVTETLWHELEQVGSSIDDQRGRGYHSGSNRRVKVNGIENKVLNIKPRALFVPCNSYSLNLVRNDFAKSSLEATSFFNLVQKIYNYI